MPAVAKKTRKTLKAKNEGKAPKKSSIKKLQKTAELNAAKKLTKSKRAVSQKLNVPFVKRQKSKHQFDPKRLKRGVVLLKNIPHGFYEKQLKKYFGQYGDVTRMRLARSEKTGRSKHFAFIEFRYPEVAQIAAESLNDYIMFRQRLKTVYIPPDKQDHDYFKQTVRVAFYNDGKVRKLVTPKLKHAQKVVREINKPKTPEQIAEINERSKYKLQYLEKKLARSGINLDLSGQLYSSGSTDEVKMGENGNDNESDDDDYEPTPEELAEADEFVSEFLSVETSDDENDTTLNRLLNDTIDSDDSEGDEDYEPTEAEIEEAKAVKKALVAAKKLCKIDSNALNAKPNAKKTNQKKRKVLAHEQMALADEAPTKVKKQKIAKKVVAEPVKVSKAKAKKTTIEIVKSVKAPKIQPVEKLSKSVKKVPKAAVKPAKKTATAPSKPIKVDKKSKDTNKVINPVAIKKKAMELKKKAVEPIPSKKVVKKTPKPDTSPKVKATSLKKKVKTKKN